jgi:hypothetical protein
VTTRIPPPGPLEHDLDGDPLPQPAAASDLADLIQLLEYARAKDFVLGPIVQVGKIRCQVADLRQAKRHGLDQQRSSEPEPSMGDLVGVPEYSPGSE